MEVMKMHELKKKKKIETGKVDVNMRNGVINGQIDLKPI